MVPELTTTPSTTFLLPFLPRFASIAFATLVVAFAATAAWIVVKGAASFTFLYDHWAGLIAASLINSFTQACFVYGMSYKEGSLLALGGNSGNVLFDVSKLLRKCIDFQKVAINLF